MSAERPRTVLVGLIGEGIGPSLSPALHELEGARHDMSYVYRLIDLEPGTGSEDVLTDLLGYARRLGYDGLNVTHPVKQTIVPLLDSLAPSAAAVGAVNTVAIGADGFVGHNTDVTGFRHAFADGLADHARRRVILLGAGGAGAAVAHALRDTGVEDLVIADADDARAEAVARACGARTVPVADVAREVSTADGIVNATPVGMAAHPGTAIDVELLDPRLFVADIVYRPTETALLAAARARGCTVMSGLGMVMHQAAESFEIFTGEPADRRAMLADLASLVAAEATSPDGGAPQKGEDA